MAPPLTKRFPTKGDVVDRVPDTWLVKYGRHPKSNPDFTPIRKDMLIPGTYWRIDPATKTIRCLVTIMPDGVYVAWWSCRACSANFSQCRCRYGITPPRSIEYIYDQTNALRAGDEWSIHHPHYKGSFTMALRPSSGPVWVPAPAKAPTPVRSAVVAPERPRKPLVRRKVEAPAPDLNVTANYDAEAAGRADDLTKQLHQRLTRRQKPSDPKPPPRLTRRKK